MASQHLSQQARRHQEMRRKIVAQHPNARLLSGSSPWTVLALPMLLILHWGSAYLVAESASILVCFIAALTFGQLCIHATGALVHETAHRLIFRGRVGKLLFDIGLEVILASYSRQLTYQYEHVTSHHPRLGDYAGDYEFEDACHAQARRMVRVRNPMLSNMFTLLTLLLHALPLGILIADKLLPVLLRRQNEMGIQDHHRHIGARKVPKHLRLLFCVISLLSNLVLLASFGWLALLYHVWALSLFLGKLGFTNLGQSLSEHEGDNVEHPTLSDYGVLNRILFNTGYHNEHHTFPNVPWHRLPALRAAAPGVFNRENPRGYIKLWWDHIRADFSESRRNPLVGSLSQEQCEEPER